MRILIEIRGGCFQGVTIEDDCGPVEVHVADWDTLENEGDRVYEVEHAIASPESFDKLLAAAEGVEEVDDAGA